MARVYVEGKVDLFRGLGKLSADSREILKADGCRHCHARVQLGIKFTKLFQAKIRLIDSDQMI